jgi:hypothetical protein
MCPWIVSTRRHARRSAPQIATAASRLDVEWTPVVAVLVLRRHSPAIDALDRAIEYGKDTHPDAALHVVGRETAPASVRRWPIRKFFSATCFPRGRAAASAVFSPIDNLPSVPLAEFPSRPPLSGAKLAAQAPICRALFFIVGIAAHVSWPPEKHLFPVPGTSLDAALVAATAGPRG